ncbi:MAG: hypothetical protein WAM85_20815 [Terracidiphilus sp.]
MRKFAAVLFLFFFFTASVNGQKTRFGQGPPKPISSPIKVHISATHIRDHCTDTFKGQSSCENGLYADAILDGKKIELFGTAVIDKQDTVLIVPGDYQAQLTKDFHSADGSVINQEYNIIFPHGTIWHCVVTGISE